MWLFDFIFCSGMQIWYVQVRISQSISESPLELEIMRVNCTSVSYILALPTWAQLFKTNVITGS